jgi:hypothetical protein
MISRVLPKLAMLRADNTNLRLVINVFHLGIVVPIPMYLPGLFDEFFGG